MGNQHPSTLEERIYFLAKNARVGDGYIWKHPECVNYKVIFTSTTPELLEVKRKIVPEIFTTGVREISIKSQKGRFANAKPMYRLASVVHPNITKIKLIDKADIFDKLTLEDFALWYLDDGCFIKRTDSKTGLRFYLCIGDCCCTEDRELKFKSKLRELFGDKWGSVRLNNSKATENNKTWFIPNPIAKLILEEARKYNVLLRKFPYGEGSTTISSESRGIGLNSSKRTLTRKSK